MPDVGAQERRTPQSYTSEVYPLQNRNWEKVIDEIFELEKLEFGDKAFERKEFEDVFEVKGSSLVLLRDKDKMIGFTYAVPLSYMMEDPEEEVADILREDNGEKTAYVMDTVIHPKYRGQHLVGQMIQTLEEELVREGYEFMERDSAVANNYANNIEKHYASQGRLLYKSPQPHDSDWGPQVSFRIKLPLAS